MIYFTKHAEEKFDILRKHQIYFTKETVEEAVKSPEKEEKKGKYIFAQKEGCRVVYKKDKEMIKVFTFYPMKK